MRTASGAGVVGLALVAISGAATAGAGVAAVWAVNDGEKVEQDDLRHPARAGNSAWDGKTVRLFGGGNEVLAVQVVVEADATGIAALSASLPELRRRGGGGRIAYAPPAADPADTVGRPVQLFSVRYMNVTEPTHADWAWKPGSPAAPKDTTGWKPVQLVPENARAGRGGFPIKVAPRRNQALWIEVYTGRGRAPGTYEGTLTLKADGRTRRVPLELELMGFTLPDENSMDAMVYYEPGQPELYQGRNLDDTYHRFAHRQRVELVHAYDEATVRAHPGRLDGADFTAARGYEGPGEGVGNRIVPVSFYGPGRGWDDRETAWRRSDAWMTFLATVLPKAVTFLYMPDEPRPAQFPEILALAGNVHSNPGAGRGLPIFVTKQWVKELEGAIDIWCAGPQQYDVARAEQERARGRRYWTYNGGRPAAGAITIDAPATDPRATIWGCFKHDVDTYFYWHGVHWRHNSQKQGERNQDVWASPITFDNRGQPNKEDFGTLNGDGVLFYPGEEKLHPAQDRGIAGPVSTIQLASFRRGLQDHQYLTLARKLGLRDVLEASLRAVVPRMFSDAGESVGFAETGDAFEAVRRKLGEAIAAARPPITRPVLFDTPEADRIVQAMQVFPPDSPWNEVVSALPALPNSDAIIASVGADKPLGFNLDMNYVIVPPDQEKVPVKVTEYPQESDPGPFPVPENAPIENWPLHRNEDTKALPKPGQSLDDLQRHGTGDRHLIIVDPVRGLLHEFWQARKTDAGWEASQASTFDLNTNKLRPERWTSADAAGLPIFPAIARYDEIARGMVRHAMRFTVRRTRRAYVYPARHWASQREDPDLPRMGERFRLRKSFDVSGFPPHARAILKGLQTYGMFMADNGSDWLMSIAPDRRLDLKGLETLSRVKGRDFEVVQTTGPDEGPRRH